MEAASLAQAPSYAGAWRTLKTPLLPWVLETVTDTLNFSQMTPVQAATIPLFLSHKDVIVEAVTGSGKTLAYLVPLLHMLARREAPIKQHHVGAIVLAPTRELATQVHSVLQTFLDAQPSKADENDSDDASQGEADGVQDSSAGPSLRMRNQILPAQLLVGGTKTTPQDDYTAFRANSPQILIGTPGRMAELLQRRGVYKTELELLILDEADRLLDANFGPTLKQILAVLPKQRRTGLFSATMTDALGELAKVGLRNPVKVVVKVAQKQDTALVSKKGKAKQIEPIGDGTQRIPAGLQNFYHISRAEHKLSQLLRIIATESGCTANSSTSTSTTAFQGTSRKFIVYFATCAQVNYFFKLLSRVSSLKKQSIDLYALHGKQHQKRRTAMLNSFTAATPIPTKSDGGAAAVLLCTDVAARGLDLPDVDVVIQFDPPTDPKVFAHRCGRTARAGRAGRAIVMLVAAVDDLPKEAEGSATVGPAGGKSGKGEEDYVEFMRIRKVPLQRYPYLLANGSPSPEPARTQPQAPPDKPFEPADKEAHAFSHSLRTLVLSDRELHDLSQRAFVSFVRAYSKHEASFIFRLGEVVLREVEGFALGWGLVRVPRMPELEGYRERRAAAKGDAQTGDGHAGSSVGFEEVAIDLRTFAYQDKAREKQRLAALAQRDAERAAASATAGPTRTKTTKRSNEDGGADASSDEDALPSSASPSSAAETDNEDEDNNANSKPDPATTRKKKKAKTEAWSHQKERKAVREERREKKRRKRAYLRRIASAGDGAGGAADGEGGLEEGGGKDTRAKNGGEGNDEEGNQGMEDEEEDDWTAETREHKRAKLASSARDAAVASDFFSAL